MRRLLGEYAAKVKPKRVVGSGIQLAHRIILSVFVPFAALLCGVFLWFLWGPKATVLNMEFGQDSKD